jgi:hypothetical protein
LTACPPRSICTRGRYSCLCGATLQALPCEQDALAQVDSARPSMWGLSLLVRLTRPSRTSEFGAASGRVWPSSTCSPLVDGPRRHASMKIGGRSHVPYSPGNRSCT